MNRFVDKNGSPVKIGDRLKYVEINVGLQGVVIKLNHQRDHKPFELISDDGYTRFWANSEYVEIIS